MLEYVRRRARGRVVAIAVIAVLLAHGIIMQACFWLLAEQHAKIERIQNLDLLFSLPHDPPAPQPVQPVPTLATAAVPPQA